jgi:hypothetical protein
MIIHLSPKIKSYWLSSSSYYSIQDFDKFMKYFLPFIQDTSEQSTINIFDIQETDIPKNKINILLCVENCPAWGHYNHYNKYNDFGDDNISIYLYNHIEKFAAIPIIYLQLDYFKKYYMKVQPSIYTPFNKKKFCLIATSINNPYKKQIDSFLNSISKCDYIKDYNYILGDKSCYHSEELLNIFNSYKFVFVCENSINNGYITEKIFNCFFSRIIPIYYGSQNINYYCNNETFINLQNITFEKCKNLINDLSEDEETYMKYINKDMINNYDDENYLQKIKKYLT